jgi:DNA-binding response OmpR family regulator
MSAANQWNDAETPAAVESRGLSGRILLIDPDPSRMRSLATQLRGYGYTPIIATPNEWVGPASQELAGIVIGPTLPPFEIGELCRSIGPAVSAPLIVLQPTGGPDSMSLILDSGADHCVPARIDAAGGLVVACIAAVMRRDTLRHRSDEANRTIRIGNFVIDLNRRTATLNGSIVPLTATEFSILALLAENSGRIMGAGDILQQIHGYALDDAEAQDVVKVHISRLRQKLSVDERAASALLNVRGQGYMYMLERRAEGRARASGEASTG